MRLLMIDDDEALADMISQHLIQQHYAVDIATNGQMGLQFIDLFTYDLVILDLMLPDLNGRSICLRIRENHHSMPILMLTSQDNAEDRIQGLDAGADDYIVKPIHLPELLARIRALLRRTSTTTPTPLCWGCLEIVPNNFEATYDHQPIALTPKEYSILELFLRNPHNSHTLDGIIDNVWALENPPSLYAIRTHIKSIRHKLKELGAPTDFIETLYGFGYRLNPAYDQADKVQVEIQNNLEYLQRSDQIAAMTQDLWFKHQSEIENRIQTIERVVHAIDHQVLTYELQQAGIDVAHKLAGALGCFGFTQGSKLAKQIELLLQFRSNPHQQKHLLQDLVMQLSQSIQRPNSDQELLPLRDRKRLLVYSHEQALLQMLQAETQQYGFSLTSVLDASTLMKQIQMQCPNVVLVDFEQVHSDNKLLSLLREKVQNIPLFAILHDHRWKKRLDYIHQGVCCIFQHPASAQSILESACYFDAVHRLPPRVLLVDDDPLLLSKMRHHLAASGFMVTTLDQPTQCLNRLQVVQPDLAMIHVEMSDIPGVELCRILRADPDWTHLPIILLTNEPDASIEDKAFAAGADDVILQNVSFQRLALRIKNRIRQAMSYTKVQGVYPKRAIKSRRKISTSNALGSPWETTTV